MKTKIPTGYITINTPNGDYVGVEQCNLNDNIFIDTNKKATDKRCYIVKDGKDKGKHVYIVHRKRIKL